MSLKIAVLRNLNELQENTEGQFKNSGRAMWMKWDFFFFFTYIEIINKEPNRVFPECLVVRIWCLHCYALGSIPDQETEIFKLCHEANKRKEKKKRNQTEKKSRRTEQKFCSLRLHWMKCNQMKKKKKKGNRKHQQQPGSSRRIFEIEDRTIDITSQRAKKKKECKRVKETQVNYGMTFTETTCILLESQKEKRERNGQRLYLKK